MFRCMPSARVQAVARLLHRKEGHNHTDFDVGMVKRVRRAKISTESVDLKPAHSAKTSQAWKYPGGKIVRAPKAMLDIKKYFDHKDPSEPRRKQESNFFITINTNKSPDDPADFDRCVKAMEGMLKTIAQDRVLASYIRFGPKHKEYEEDVYSDVVHSVDWKANVETGDIMKRVHAHIWMTMTHYSQVQINVHALMHLAKQGYNAELGAHAKTDLYIKDMPYVHVKLLPQSDWTDVMRQYIHKGMGV